MIKIIHQIWLGARSIPSQYLAWSDTWRLHHPGWEFRLWTDSSLEAFKRSMQIPFALFRQMPIIVQSDILRLELMREFGGMYADFDYECIGNLEDLLNESSFHYADEVEGRPGNAWFYSPDSGHAFVCWMLSALSVKCKRVLEDEARCCGDILNFSGPDAFHHALHVWLYPWKAKAINAHPDGTALAADFGDVRLLKDPVMSPFWPSSNRSIWQIAVDEGRVQTVYPHARAVHHYGHSWKNL